ncbi:MAG: SIR2 family protein [Bacteroidales bacterium]|nr:SIR2 family protein [Bacteroidales bacterium]
MEIRKIKDISDILKENELKKRPGAILFIGAGCSVSANIPTAEGVIKKVKEKYNNNEYIKNLKDDSKYADVMNYLLPVQRKELFQDYLTNAKINVSHIYLANLMLKGYVDYIVTVNFDNLAQRALALYNHFPPIYDISTFKDITTTPLDIKSIIYLHGQHNGVWQLNTTNEMGKNGTAAKIILHKIANNRTWIVVGYSGRDFVFNKLVKLGRFDNGIYWVVKEDDNQEPSETVLKKLLNRPYSDSYLVKTVDSDTFFMTLNAELGIGEPPIFSTPFTFLSDLLGNIKDIDSARNYKPIKERLAIDKMMVQDAINRYEKIRNQEPKMPIEDIEQFLLKCALIDYTINDKYDELIGLEKKVNNEWQTKFYELILALNNPSKEKTRTKLDEEFVNSYKDTFKMLKEIVGSRSDYNEELYKGAVFLGKTAEIEKDIDNALLIYKLAIKTLIKAVISGISYYLACTYAKAKNKDIALGLLGICLKHNKIEFDNVNKDFVWEGLREEPEYVRLKELYLK